MDESLNWPLHVMHLVRDLAHGLGPDQEDDQDQDLVIGEDPVQGLDLDRDLEIADVLLENGEETLGLGPSHDRQSKLKCLVFHPVHIFKENNFTECN